MTRAQPTATFDHAEFPPEMLLECKGGTRVTVCIPARDEAATIASIVSSLRLQLVEMLPLLDEILVVDDGSTDGTGAVAEAAGALVVPAPAPAAGGNGSVPDVPRQPPQGKGAAMARGVACSTGDIVVFLDGDVTNFGPHFVTGLLGPLFVDREIQLVKGKYARPLAEGGAGGGRVTELVARPLISLLFPELDGVAQPLAGETAARRQALDRLELEPDYGVELALLLDMVDLYGPGCVAQVDLGARLHRNRPLPELAPQARAVLRVALARAGVRAT